MLRRKIKTSIQAELALVNCVPANITESNQWFLGTQMAHMPRPDGHWALPCQVWEQVSLLVPHTDKLGHKLWQSTNVHLPLGQHVRSKIKLIVLHVHPTQPVAVKLRRHLYGSAHLFIWEAKDQFILPIKTTLLKTRMGSSLIRNTQLPHLKTGLYCPASLVKKL